MHGADQALVGRVGKPGKHVAADLSSHKRRHAAGPVNRKGVAYMRERYGRVVDTTERVIDYDGERASYTYLDDEGNEIEW